MQSWCRNEAPWRVQVFCNPLFLWPCSFLCEKMKDLPAVVVLLAENEAPWMCKILVIPFFFSADNKQHKEREPECFQLGMALFYRCYQMCFWWNHKWQGWREAADSQLHSAMFLFQWTLFLYMVCIWQLSVLKSGTSLWCWSFSFWNIFSVWRILIFSCKFISLHSSENAQNFYWCPKYLFLRDNFRIKNCPHHTCSPCLAVIFCPLIFYLPCLFL